MEFKEGDTVVYAKPMPDEIYADGTPVQFKVMEVFGQKAIIQAVVPGFMINPTQVAYLTELIKVEAKA